jgi:hypothetical protein
MRLEPRILASPFRRARLQLRPHRDMGGKKGTFMFATKHVMTERHRGHFETGRRPATAYGGRPRLQ